MNRKQREQTRDYLYKFATRKRRHVVVIQRNGKTLKTLKIDEGYNWMNLIIQHRYGKRLPRDIATTPRTLGMIHAHSITHTGIFGAQVDAHVEAYRGNTDTGYCIERRQDRIAAPNWRKYARTHGLRE